MVVVGGREGVVERNVDGVVGSGRLGVVDVVVVSCGWVLVWGIEVVLMVGEGACVDEGGGVGLLGGFGVYFGTGSATWEGLGGKGGVVVGVVVGGGAGGPRRSRIRSRNFWLFSSMSRLLANSSRWNCWDWRVCSENIERNSLTMVLTSLETVVGAVDLACPAPRVEALASSVGVVSVVGNLGG